MLQYERIDVSQGNDLNKSEKMYDLSLKKLVINMNHIFVINVMIY